MNKLKSATKQLKVNLQREPVRNIKVSGSLDAAEYLRELWEDIDIYESSFAIYLNRANNTIGWFKVSQGGLTSTVMDVRLIMKVAIENLATGIIIAHNHPSGNLNPSQADINISRQIKEAAKLFDITLFDSLILAPESGYTSLADEGIL